MALRLPRKDNLFWHQAGLDCTGHSSGVSFLATDGQVVEVLAQSHQPRFEGGKWPGVCACIDAGAITTGSTVETANCDGIDFILEPCQSAREKQSRAHSPHTHHGLLAQWL